MMEFMLDLPIVAPPKKINYAAPLLFIGSCFTEHIGTHLQQLKFNVLQNPNGILFDPHSVSDSLISYIQNRQYTERDLFFLNELWQSWHHHSMFSGNEKNKCLRLINEAQDHAHQFLKKTKWVIVTLGSAFSYRLKETGMPVANCHRAPAQWFNKHLMNVDEINTVLDNCIHQLFFFNPDIRIIFTVSPVRHLRDGIIENNRSKARLIEVVHNLTNKFDKLHYFPAYELVIDVLRDYRFFDIDMVHPNYQATEFVLEKFSRHFIDEPSQELMEEVRKITIAKKHKAFHPDSHAHRQFLFSNFEKAQQLNMKYPFLDMSDEINYFSSFQKKSR